MGPGDEQQGRSTLSLSIGGAGVARFPLGVEGESCDVVVVVVVVVLPHPGDIPVCPPLDIPRWPAGRVSVRDRGTQLTLSGTTACVNGHWLKDFQEKFLFQDASRGAGMLAWGGCGEG